MLSQEAIEEFKQLYFKEFGIRITNDQAFNLGTQLKSFVKTVYGDNIPKKWNSTIDKEKGSK